jgi:hypothetical protein
MWIKQIHAQSRRGPMPADEAFQAGFAGKNIIEINQE